MEMTYTSSKSDPIRYRVIDHGDSLVLSGRCALGTLGKWSRPDAEWLRGLADFYLEVTACQAYTGANGETYVRPFRTRVGNRKDLEASDPGFYVHKFYVEKI